MDTSKLSFGETIAGVSGALLIIFMFILDWWGYDVGSGAFSASANASAFQWLSFLDIVLFLVGAIAIAAAVARATGSMPSDLPQPPGLIVAGAGALAVLIIVFRILIPGDGPAGDLGGLADSIDSTRKIGAFFGLIAAGGIAFGGWTAMNEQASGQAPPAGGQAPPPEQAPPPGQAPPEQAPPA